MGRYFDPPKEYRPGLVFQLREDPEGGDLLSEVHQHPAIDPYGRAEAIVLVHGFNNHYGDAGEAYYGLRTRQYDLTDPPAVPPALEKILGDVFWPGDAAWGLFDFADFLVYPSAVGTARDAGPRLARHLQSMPNLRMVHFLGHSLGCRVILEAIEYLRLSAGPVIASVCLMAAAVPLFKVKSGGALADAIEHAAEVRVLHSDDDWVLRDTFPPGQTLAGGNEGNLPTALGLNGPLGVAGRIESFDITDAGHGDYWGHSKKPAAALAAGRIAEFLRFGKRSRTISSRAFGMASRPDSADQRDVGRSRRI